MFLNARGMLGTTEIDSNESIKAIYGMSHALYNVNYGIISRSLVTQMLNFFIGDDI